MLPSTSSFLKQELKFKEQPTKTYKMNTTKNFVRGYSDKLKAMEQAVYKILFTERYRYVIYSWDYGIELDDLFGEPVSYVCPELERRISEALLWDSRIKNVDNFEFDTSKKGEVYVTFTVHTIFGDLTADRVVNI